MGDYRRRAGQDIGRWTLEEPLGKGGNAEVWRAREAKGGTAAVKLLRTLKPRSESYQRFKDEVAVLRRIGQHPGVLFLIDGEVPDHPSYDSPAWFSMPVARGIRDAFGASPELEDLVGAVAAIARILADLLEEKGIAHRDIKPSNIFSYEDRWVLSDFGLAAFPGKEELTLADRKLGPRDYIAPEMLDHPDIADEGPADVYSLAKTLWVLAADKTYPPQGQVRLDIPSHRLASYVRHPRVHFLDRLISVATDEDPKSRLSMRELDEELSAWLVVSMPQYRTPNLTSMPKLIYESLPADPDRDIELGLSSKDRADGLAAWFGARLQIIGDSLALVAPCDGLVHDDDAVITQFFGAARPGQPSTIWQGGRCVLVKGPELPKPTRRPYEPLLRIGVGLELRDDGKLLIRAAHLVSRRDGLRERLWFEERVVVPGWPRELVVAEELLKGLGSGVSRALRRFAKEVAAGDPPPQ